MKGLVLYPDLLAKASLAGAVSEYFQMEVAGAVMFDEIDPDILEEIRVIVFYTKDGPRVFTVTEYEDDIDLEADTALEKENDRDHTAIGRFRNAITGRGTA